MRGQVWVEAVLYIAIGVVAISLILSAGLPVINKMRDRNTVMQTKELLHTFDSAIRQVAGEGLGSQRSLDPVIIKGGRLDIKENEIVWRMDTTAEIMESCGYEDECDKELIQHEGNIDMSLFRTPVVGEYVINLGLKYNNLIMELDENSIIKGSLTGKYSILVSNSGVENNKPVVKLKVR